MIDITLVTATNSETEVIGITIVSKMMCKTHCFQNHLEDYRHPVINSRADGYKDRGHVIVWKHVSTPVVSVVQKIIVNAKTTITQTLLIFVAKR